MDPKLEQAVQAIKTGDKAAGLVLLAQVIRTDPNSESAWIWMATAQDDPEKKKQCLERVLRINPANERVRRALATMFPAPAQPEAVLAAIEAAPQAEPVIGEQPEVHKEELAVEVVPALVTEEPAALEPDQAPVETPQEAAPVTLETTPVEAAPPDLSWLKETSSAPAAPKDEAADLSWLKEDLPAESLADEGYQGFGTAQPESAEPAWLKDEVLPAEDEVKKDEPALDLSWLKEDQPSADTEAASFTWPDETKAQEAGAEALWEKEEQPPAQAEEAKTPSSPTPVADTGDLAWLRVDSSGPTEQPAAAPVESEEPDFSWLHSEPASEEKPAEQPFSEAVFPWLNEEPGSTEGPAVLNEAESIPDWLRQGAGQASEMPGPVPSEVEPAAAGPALPEAAEQEPATLESEPLTTEDFDKITSKRAELPFSWDEVTGAPVIKPPEKTASVPFAAAAGEPSEASFSSANISPATPSKAGLTPISRPISAPLSVDETAQKKGLTGGQIILLGLFGLVCLIALLAAGFYFALNAGWLKAFGF